MKTNNPVSNIKTILSFKVSFKYKFCLTILTLTFITDNDKIIGMVKNFGRNDILRQNNTINIIKQIMKFSFVYLGANYPIRGPFPFR